MCVGGRACLLLFVYNACLCYRDPWRRLSMFFYTPFCNILYPVRYKLYLRVQHFPDVLQRRLRTFASTEMPLFNFERD